MESMQLLTTKDFSEDLVKRGRTYYSRYAQFAEKQGPKCFRDSSGEVGVVLSLSTKSSLLTRASISQKTVQAILKDLGGNVDENTFLRRITTDQPDLYLDVVHGKTSEKGDGIDASQWNGTVLWSHINDNVKVATSSKLYQSEEGGFSVTDAVTQYHCLTAFSKECRDFDAAGLMPDSSIGFIPKRGQWSLEKDPNDPDLLIQHFWGIWLKEFSLCEIPANPGAHGSSPMSAAASELSIDPNGQLVRNIMKGIAIGAVNPEGLIVKSFLKMNQIKSIGVLSEEEKEAIIADHQKRLHANEEQPPQQLSVPEVFSTASQEFKSILDNFLRELKMVPIVSLNLNSEPAKTVELALAAKGFNPEQVKSILEITKSGAEFSDANKKAFKAVHKEFGEHAKAVTKSVKAFGKQLAAKGVDVDGSDEEPDGDEKNIQALIALGIPEAQAKAAVAILPKAAKEEEPVEDDEEMGEDGKPKKGKKGDGTEDGETTDTDKAFRKRYERDMKTLTKSIADVATAVAGLQKAAPVTAAATTVDESKIFKLN